MLEKYWVVGHNTDTTETGCHMRNTYIKTIWEGFGSQQSCEEGILQDFCFERFGPKTVYVQGVAACPGWTIRVSDEQSFNYPVSIQWGGLPTKTMIIELGIGGKNGAINILSERYSKDPPIKICEACGHIIS